jgi:chromosome segregation ATPase
MDNTQDFLNKINSTQKTIGHNKFKLKIDELTQKLQQECLNYQILQEKSSLSNTTITTLQSQLQEKSLYISQLENNLENENLRKQLEKLYTEIDNQNITLSDSTTTISSLQSNLDSTLLQNSKLTNDYDILLHKNEELQMQYKIQEINLQNTINDLHHKIEDVTNLQHELNLKNIIIEKIEDEMTTLKSELILYKTNDECPNTIDIIEEEKTAPTISKPTALIKPTTKSRRKKRN